MPWVLEQHSSIIPEFPDNIDSLTQIPCALKSISRLLVINMLYGSATIMYSHAYATRAKSMGFGQRTFDYKTVGCCFSEDWVQGLGPRWMWPCERVCVFKWSHMTVERTWPKEGLAKAVLAQH